MAHGAVRIPPGTYEITAVYTAKGGGTLTSDPAHFVVFDADYPVANQPKRELPKYPKGRKPTSILGHPAGLSATRTAVLRSRNGVGGSVGRLSLDTYLEGGFGEVVPAVGAARAERPFGWGFVYW